MPNINGVICKQAFPDFMSIGRGDAGYNLPCYLGALVTASAAGVEFVLWQATVPAQEVWMWGQGNPAYSENQGYMWLVPGMIDTTSFGEGTIRLASNNNSNTNPKFTLVQNTTRLHLPDYTDLVSATPFDRRTMQPLPCDVRSARGFSSKLQILFTPDGTGYTPTAGEIGFSIPFMRYLL